MSCKSGAKTRKIIEIYQYTRKSRKQFETNEKLKVAKQATSKASFPAFQAQSSVLWCHTSYQKTMGIMI